MVPDGEYIPFLLCPSIKLVYGVFIYARPGVHVARERVEITRDDAATRGAARRGAARRGASRRTHATRETTAAAGKRQRDLVIFFHPPPPPPPVCPSLSPRQTRPFL